MPACRLQACTGPQESRPRQLLHCSAPRIQAAAEYSGKAAAHTPLLCRQLGLSYCWQQLKGSTRVLAVMQLGQKLQLGCESPC